MVGRLILRDFLTQIASQRVVAGHTELSIEMMNICEYLSKDFRIYEIIK